MGGRTTRPRPGRTPSRTGLEKEMDEDDRRRISQTALSAIPELVLAPIAAVPSPRFPATVLICRHDQPLHCRPDGKVAGWANGFCRKATPPWFNEFLLGDWASGCQAKSECAGTRIFCLGASRCGRGARSGRPARARRPAVAHKRRGGRSRPSNGETASRSAADRTAVVLCDDDDRRSRRHPSWKSGQRLAGFSKVDAKSASSPGCCGATNRSGRPA